MNPNELHLEAQAAEWFCCAISRYGYRCTLTKDHAGAHLAEGIGRLCDAWSSGTRTVVLSGGPHDGAEVSDPGPAIFFNRVDGVHVYTTSGVYLGISPRRNLWQRVCDWWGPQ